jgi:hypothetical protein
MGSSCPGNGSTLLATTGDASNYLDFSFGANNINYVQGGLFKLEVMWNNVTDAPEYFTIDVSGLSFTLPDTTSTPPSNPGGPGDGLGCANHDCSGNQIGGGGGAPSGGAVLGISTGPAALGLATLLPVTLGTNVLGAEISPAQSGEVLGTATGSATPTVNPSVSPTTPTLLEKNPVSSSTNWALGYMPIGLVILIVLALIAYLIYRKKKLS